MKIIQILPCLTMGGAENLVKEYLLNFDEGQTVELLCLGGHKGTVLEEMLEKRVPVTYMGESYKVPTFFPAVIKRILSPIMWRRWLRHYIKIKRPDVIHCHLSGAREMMAVRGVLRKTKLVYTIHTDPAVLWKNPDTAKERAAITYLVKHRSMEVIALHSQMAEQIHHYLPSNVKIHIVNNAVDFSRLRNPLRQRRAVLQELGIPEDSLIIGHIGRFNEPKNHMFLVDIFARVHACNSNAHLLLVGDGPLCEAVKQHVKYYGLIAYVHILGNRMDVPDLLASFDYFLFPSLWEGFPMTLIEAQVAKVKCLISDVITNEVCLTSLVKKESLDASPEQWANTLLNWQDEDYQEYRLQRYDIRNVLDELICIYTH